MYAEERQQAMAELVTRRGRMSVADLSREFEVTTETVRRDLSTLERLNLLRRVHGGAVPVDTLTVIEAGLSDRDVEHTSEKGRIAATALDLVPLGDATLLIDAGTTTARFAELLPRDRRLTVFTHAVPVAARLAGLSHVELHVLPGRVRFTTQAAVGTETVAALQQIRADLAFVGTNGISLGHGLSTPDRTEAATKAALIASSNRVVLLSDSSKIGRERTVRFANLTDIDVFVTDDGISETDIKSFESFGMEVVVA